MCPCYLGGLSLPCLRKHGQQDDPSAGTASALSEFEPVCGHPH